MFLFDFFWIRFFLDFGGLSTPGTPLPHLTTRNKMKKQCKIRRGAPPRLRGRRHRDLIRGGRVKPRFTRCTLTKTFCFIEANAKRTIYLKTGAVKEGDFRGKLSLGSTSPLSPTLRSKKKIAERLAERFFQKRI